MTATEQATKIFKKTYGNSANFMTPDLIRYGLLADYVAYELSSGSGLGGSTLYGVTVLRSTYGRKVEKLRDISKCFDSLAEAELYIKKLTKEMSK